MTDTQKVTINAPTLGADLIGTIESEHNVAMFRGIPYATVNKRWTHSETRHTLEGTYDATEYGPRCSQRKGMVLVSGANPDPMPGDDEFRCLNLNVAVPNEVLQSKSEPLPVMVWIHGGGFSYGANSVARYRPQKFVSHARSSNTPVIVVQMSYRLGAFGFAASEDLATEVEGTSYPTGNYALIDQRNALEWVNTHIADFGGDPKNITAFGISAGSASIHAHLLAGTSLFDRAIMMSGSAPTLFPVRMELFEDQWKGFCERTEAPSSTPATRLEHLRALSTEDVIKHFSPAVMGPVGDGKYLPKTWKATDNVSNARCKSIILGDTNFEALILDGLLQVLTQEMFHGMVKKNFPEDKYQEFCREFSFTLGQSADDFRDSFRVFVGCVLFQYPNISIAEASGQSDDWRNNVYLYHFEEPSPFPGVTEGKSYHGLCALLTHMNEFDRCPPPTQGVSKEVARTWAGFAHGQQPWEAYSKENKFMRFGPEGKNGLYDFAGDNTRIYSFLPWLKENYEEIRQFVREELMYKMENAKW